jgi:hypothetical protein
MTFGDHHPPLWLREHPNVPAPRKVASSKGRRTVPIGTPTAKKRKSGRSKKRKAPAVILLPRLRRRSGQLLPRLVVVEGL